MNALSVSSLVLLSTFGLLACSADDSAPGDGDGDMNSLTGGSGGTVGGTGGAEGTGSSASSGGTGAGGDGAGTGGNGTGSAEGTGGAPPAGVLFSSDFESDTVGNVMPGGSTWTTTLPTEYDSGGIVSVVGDKAHGGTKSVYVKKSNNGQSFLQLTHASVFPFAGTKIYVRAYINVPEWPTNHVSWMEVGSATNEVDEMRIGAHQGVMQVNHWPGDQDQIAEGITFAANEWHCIEYAYDAATAGLEVWLDDTKIDALTVVGGVFARPGAPGVPAPPINAVRFGTEIAATEAWFDDIAVGTGPIGCAQ
jgi:hypothetical protein